MIEPYKNHTANKIYHKTNFRGENNLHGLRHKFWHGPAVNLWEKQIQYFDESLVYISQSLLPSIFLHSHFNS